MVVELIVFSVVVPIAGFIAFYQFMNGGRMPFINTNVDIHNRRVVPEN